MNLQKNAARILLVAGIVFFGASMHFVCFCKVNEAGFTRIVALNDAEFHQATTMTRAEFVAEHQREVSEVEGMHENSEFTAMAGFFCLLSAAAIGLGRRRPGGPKV
jgi:hypothetical protein